MQYFFRATNPIYTNRETAFSWLRKNRHFTNTIVNNGVVTVEFVAEATGEALCASYPARYLSGAKPISYRPAWEREYRTNILRGWQGIDAVPVGWGRKMSEPYKVVWDEKWQRPKKVFNAYIPPSAIFTSRSVRNGVSTVSQTDRSRVEARVRRVVNCGGCE